MSRAILSLLCLLALLPGTGPAFAATPDVRILIDVSGSMRQTDPQNLRVPALRLVNELLPVGVRAGVWLFAEKTQVLSPVGEVDATWKAQTRARLGRIHARGLFTDIEQAIEAAVTGWEGPAATGERHIVLLTDGLVDVSKDEAQSLASRERILSAQLERLQRLHVKVHAIALSDQVDTKLMRILAGRTDGWLESPKDADALQRVFLRILEQTTAPMTVPLKGNRFEIDDQVSEFTLLAFRGAGGATRLRSPSGEEISSSSRTEGTLWRTEADYDLVTLADPMPGEWELEGVSDPDNRVVVVTDLGIEMEPLPSALQAGSSQRIETWLTERQRPVRRPDLLKILQATALVARVSRPEQAPPREEKSAPTRSGAQSPASDQIAGSAAPHATQENPEPTELHLRLDQESGHFRADLDTRSLSPGIYRIAVLIDGGTFKRQLTKRFKLTGPPISLHHEQRLPSEETESAALDLTLDVEPELVDPKSLFGYLLILGPEGQQSVVDLPRPSSAPLHLRVAVERPGEYLVKGHLMARSLTGELVDVEPEPRHLVFDFEQSAASKWGASKEEPDGQDLSWIALGTYLLGGNAILGSMLGLTWWLLQRPRQPGEKPPSKPAETKKPKAKRG